MQARTSAVRLTLRRVITATLAAILALALGACSRDDDDKPAPPAPPQSASRIQVEVSRTTHGVPHVRAENFRSLAYGLAHAYAQDSVCMFADSVLTVRGERSLFFGAKARPRQRTGDGYGGGSGFMDLSNEESDFFFKGYLDIEQLLANYAAGAAAPRELLEGFVEGYNRYLKDAAGKLPAACAFAYHYTTYLYDGERRKMRSKTLSVDALLPGLVGRRSKTFYFSHQGAVIVRPAAGMSWTSSAAFVLADPNRHNTRMLEQWLGIGTAGSVRALKDSLDRVVGLPWVNTVAADRDGNALYADASVVPHMNANKFVNGCLLVRAALMFDGSRSACAWGQDAGAPPGIHAPARAPCMLRTDYVGNSNDSYWLTNPKALLSGPAPLGFSPLYGPTGVEQSLRTRIGFRQLEDLLAQRSKLTLADMQALASSNRVYAAERVLPELLPACAALSNELSNRACNTLQAWDRRANVDRRGAVLFREFWSVASAIPNKWALPFDPADPVNTPRGVAPAAMPAMLMALRGAAEKLQSLGIAFDAPLGDYQVEPRKGVRIPLHGGNGNQEGTYGSLTMRTGLTAAGYVGAHWGQSYIQTVGFDDAGPVAHAMLTCGQSTDLRSPWYADQTMVYSRKESPLLPNYTTATLRE